VIITNKRGVIFSCHGLPTGRLESAQRLRLKNVELVDPFLNLEYVKKYTNLHHRPLKYSP